MTNFLLGGLLVFAVGTALECFFLLGVIQRLRTTFEQLLAAAQQLLAAVPSKSAEPTDGPDESVSVDRFPRLRLLAGLRDLVRELNARPGVGPGTTVADALSEKPPHDQADDTPTAPMQRVDLAGGLRVITGDQPGTPPPEDIDSVLARFTYQEGHRR